LLLVIERFATAERHARLALLLAAVGGIALFWVGSANAGGYTDASYLTPRGTVGQPYSHRVEWKPGNGCPPYTYAVVGGDFPPGLSLSSDGYLSGVPTREGRYSFYIRQTDLCGPEGEGNSPFVITIDPVTQPPPPPPPPQLVVNGGTLPTAEATLPYAATLSASGGSGSKSWSVTSGQLPQGLTLSSDGRLSGTPQAGGSYGFRATVTAGSSSASADFALTVVPGLAVALVTKPPMLEVRRPFTAKLTDLLSVTGGTPPYRFAPVGGFPFGIGLDPTAGTLFGSPRRGGVVTLTIRVLDANGATLDTALSFDVLEQLRLAIGRLPTPHVGRKYRAALEVNGGTGVVWRIASGSLPAGLTLNTTTGIVSGTPRRAGVVRFTLSVQDTLGAGVSTRIKLTVA
jgi:large repetitive protein